MTRPSYVSASAIGSMIAAFGGYASPPNGGGGANAFTIQSRVAHYRTLKQGDGAISGVSSRSSLSPSTSNGIICARSWRSSCKWVLMMPHKLDAAMSSSQQLRPRRRSPSTATIMSLGSSADDLKDPAPPGTIVAFETETKGRSTTLGLVIDRVVGKKKSALKVKLACRTAAGGAAIVTVAMKQVKYVVPGGSGYLETDLASFEHEENYQDGNITAVVDGSILQEAWEMLLEEDEARDVLGDGGGERAAVCDPRDMAQLLFGIVEPTPKECYRAFRLLEGEGSLYFKRRRDGLYECRSRCALVVVMSNHTLGSRI